MQEVSKSFDSVESMIKGVLPKLLNSKYGKVGQAKNCAHEINLKLGTTFHKKWSKACAGSFTRRTVSIDSMLARGIIRPSKQEWAVPLVIVKKETGLSEYAYTIET